MTADFYAFDMKFLGETATRIINEVILFSDSIIGVDDYKDSFRSQRLKKFDFIGFLKIERETYSTLARDAADFARSMAFSFDGSKPAGDVVSFFESLRIDPQLRWDIFVSSEYLTLSLLVNNTNDIAMRPRSIVCLETKLPIAMRLRPEKAFRQTSQSNNTRR